MLTKWSKDFAIPQVWHIRTGIVEEARFGESTVYIVSRNIRKPLFGTQIEGKSECSDHKHIGDTTKHNTNKIVYSSGNRTNRIFFRVMVFMMRSTWLQEVQFYCVPTIWWRTLGRSSLCSQFMISCMYPCWCVLLVEFLHPTLWGDYKGVISIVSHIGILKTLRPLLSSVYSQRAPRFHCVIVIIPIWVIGVLSIGELSLAIT